MHPWPDLVGHPNRRKSLSLSPLSLVIHTWPDLVVHPCVQIDMSHFFKLFINFRRNIKNINILFLHYIWIIVQFDLLKFEYFLSFLHVDIQLFLEKQNYLLTNLMTFSFFFCYFVNLWFCKIRIPNLIFLTLILMPDFVYIYIHIFLDLNFIYLKILTFFRSV